MRDVQFPMCDLQFGIAAGQLHHVTAGLLVRLLGARQEHLLVAEQDGVVQSDGRLSGQDPQDHGVDVVRRPPGTAPRREPADHPTMQDQRDRHGLGAAGLGDLGGTPAPEHRQQRVDHALGHPVRHRREVAPLESHESARGVDQQVPRFDRRQLPVPQGHQRPLGIELVIGDAQDRSHQLLRAVGRAHQCA